MSSMCYGSNVTISITDQHGTRTIQGVACHLIIDHKMLTEKVGLADEVYQCNNVTLSIELLNANMICSAQATQFVQKPKLPKAKQLSRKLLLT